MEHRARGDVICHLRADRAPGNLHTFHRWRKQEMNRDACALQHQRSCYDDDDDDDERDFDHRDVPNALC